MSNSEKKSKSHSKKSKNVSSKKVSSSLSLPSQDSASSVSIPSDSFCLNKCCCCFKCCFKNQEVKKREMHAFLVEGARRFSNTGQIVLPHMPKRKVAGYAEEGYLTQPPRKSDVSITMQNHRKLSPATENLAEPEIAILNTNFRRGTPASKKSKKNLKEEANMIEINSMLKSRLSGCIAIGRDAPDEKGEALLKCNRTGRDYTPYLLSHLVKESDKRRMSVQLEPQKTKYNSSYSRYSVDLQVAPKIPQKELNLDERSDTDFINQLTEASTLVKNELETDWSFTLSYVKTLEKFVKTQQHDVKKSKAGSERWMVILYTTSEETDELTNFRCLLARLILQHYCVAYEERDVALKNLDYKEELLGRLNTDAMTIPYIFAHGIAIGNCQVVYAIHRLNLMKTIFKNYIMAEEVYADWLSRKNVVKDNTLKMEVKVSMFPALNVLMGLTTELKLSSDDNEKTKIGKEIVRKARAQWAKICKSGFTQPPLLRFVLLRRTILITLSIMNDIYQAYMTKKMIAHQQLRKRKFSWLK